MLISPIVITVALLQVQAPNYDVSRDTAVRELAIAEQCDKNSDYSEVIKVMAVALGLSLNKPSSADGLLVQDARRAYKDLGAAGKKLACKLAFRIVRKATKEFNEEQKID